MMANVTYDYPDNTSEENGCKIKDGTAATERVRVRSRCKLHKQRNLNIPIGIFWDIENCQVPRGCSATDVVAAIRAKFLNGRREADFVVACVARKQSPKILEQLNNAHVNIIAVCETQKNAADQKLRQHIRKFGEMHSAPATMVLISGDINFVAELCDLRYRKNMEVILVHQQNTSSALIACASSHYCYKELTGNLPRNPKRASKTGVAEELTYEMEVDNLLVDKLQDTVSDKLERLAGICKGKVVSVTASTAVLQFSTLDQLLRAVKLMHGQYVYSGEIITRCRSSGAPVPQTYSSDKGYRTMPTAPAVNTTPITPIAPLQPIAPVAPIAPITPIATIAPITTIAPAAHTASTALTVATALNLPPVPYVPTATYMPTAPTAPTAPSAPSVPRPEHIKPPAHWLTSQNFVNFLVFIAFALTPQTIFKT